MALFAVIDNTIATRIVRVELDATASTSVTAIFQQQRQYFESHHNNMIPFYAGYTPKHSECFEIQNLTDSARLIDAVNRPTAVPIWDPSQIDIGYIKALFVGVDAPANPNIIALQTFNKKQILDTSKSFFGKLFASKTTFSKANSIGFNVDDKLVAIIINDTIRFKSFFNLRSIFDMSSYFSAATDQELNAFSQLSVFSTPQGFDLKSVADTVIRNKVTLINQTGMLTPQNMSKFKSEAAKVNFPLQTIIVGGVEKIVMPSSKKEIKALLDFLEEDIWVSGISGRRFKSNSKRPI
ncbi:TPA: Kiwa anti-phage protein KwaB-like domain-containing protein [Escherichia coli]